MEKKMSDEQKNEEEDKIVKAAHKGRPGKVE